MKYLTVLMAVVVAAASCTSAGTFVADPQTPTVTPSGTDWPQWRGPSRDGSIGTALPDQWPDALQKRWEVPVGAGHASPVVSGNRVVVIARESDQEIVRARTPLHPSSFRIF